MKKSPKQSPPPPQGNRRNIPPDATSPSFCRGSGLILIRASFILLFVFALAALVSCADVPTAPENAVEPAGKISSSSIDDNDVRWFLLHSRHILVGQPRVWKVCKGGPQGKIFNGETKDLGNCGLAGNVNSLPIAVVARVRVSPHSNNFTLNWEESGGGTLASHAMNNRAVRGQRARILENDPYVDGNEPLWFTSKGWAYFALCGGNPSPVGYGVEGTPDEPRGWAEWLKFIENKDDLAKAYFNCAPGIGNNSSNRARVKLKGKTFTASMTYRVSDNPAARDQWHTVGGFSFAIAP